MQSSKMGNYHQKWVGCGYFSDISIEMCGFWKGAGAGTAVRKCLYYTLGLMIPNQNTWFCMNGKENHLLRSTLYWEHPGDLLEWRNHGLHENYWLCMLGSRAEHMIRSLDARNKKQFFFLDSYDELRGMFQEICQSAPFYTASQPEQLMAKIEEALGGTHSFSKKETAIREYMQRIAAEPEFVYDFQTDCRQFGLGYDRFRNLFCKLSGLPPHQYVLCRRVEKAKQLLMQSMLSIKEISEQCGFASSTEFGKTFRHKTGRSPGEWQTKFYPEHSKNHSGL